MNSFCLANNTGEVNNVITVKGAYSSADVALATAITTGAPYNWQTFQVYGPPVQNPSYPYSPQDVSVGAWLALCPAIAEDGSPILVGYGTFSSQAAAIAWAQTQQSPTSFSFGLVAA